MLLKKITFHPECVLIIPAIRWSMEFATVCLRGKPWTTKKLLDIVRDWSSIPCQGRMFRRQVDLGKTATGEKRNGKTRPYFKEFYGSHIISYSLNSLGLVPSPSHGIRTISHGHISKRQYTRIVFSWTISPWQYSLDKKPYNIHLFSISHPCQ